MMKSNKALLVAALVTVAAPALAAGKDAKVTAAAPAVAATAAVEAPTVSYVATAKVKASEFGSAVKNFYTANSRFQNVFNGLATVLAVYEIASRATASNDVD